MTHKKTGVLTSLASVLVYAVAMTAAVAADRLDQTLDLIEQWIADGVYDTSAQVDADIAKDVPDRLKHRLMFQVFQKVDIDWLDGLTYFQQGSSDGTLDTTFRAGILNFYIDRDAGAVRLRELNFSDVPAWLDAYKTPDKIASMTAEDVKWDEGCDFFLLANESATEVRGPMREGTCKLPEEQFGMPLVAEDEAVIRPGEFWFLGRFVDDTGAVMWGNESDELNKLVIQK